MPPKSNVPQRICGSKVRSGCKTCKERHVKCDERRPTCLRCQKAKRQCTYDRLQSWARQWKPQPNPQTEVAVSGALNDRRHSASPRLVFDINPYGPYEVAEVNALKVFTTHLGKELSGSFSDDVWCQTLPRVAQHEPVIWRAIVAVSMLDISTRLNHDYHGLELNKAIKQYSMALQELNIRLGSMDSTCSKNVVLLSIVLFAIFECLQRNYGSAMRHISGGMKLLMEWKYETQSIQESSSNSYLDYNTLAPIFLSLDLQAVEMGIVSFRDYTSLPALTHHIQIPTAFTSTEEAHFALTYLFNRIARWGYWVEPSSACGERPSDDWMEMEEHWARDQLAMWDTAFDTPLRLFYSEDATLLLTVHRKIIGIILEKQVDGPSEMGWDKYLPLFRETVEDAEKYMKHTVGDWQPYTSSDRSRSEGSDPPRPVFTVAMDIVMSLYLISAKCRDSLVRRQALAMLKICGRREGIWDSHGAAKVAEKIMLMEERGALSNGFIPESARVYEIDIRLKGEKIGEIVYRRLVSHNDGSYHIETTREVQS